jgi:hypothetical protein
MISQRELAIVKVSARGLSGMGLKEEWVSGFKMALGYFLQAYRLYDVIL